MTPTWWSRRGRFDWCRALLVLRRKYPEGWPSNLTESDYWKLT